MNSSLQIFVARLLFLPLLLVGTVAGLQPTPPLIEAGSLVVARPASSEPPAGVDSNPPESRLRASLPRLSPPTTSALPIDLGSLEPELRLPLRTRSARIPFASAPALSDREIWWGRPDRPWIALTFDAEVGGEMGAEVLDILQAAEVRATFFVTGAWARRHPDLVQRMLAEGHLIGNHTDSHARLIELDDEAIRQELRRAEATLVEITGHDPRPWFRPPFGKRDARVRRIAAEERYLTVAWSTDVMNWLRANTPQSMIDKALSEARNGSIIVFHLNRMDTEALPAIIRGLRAGGYRLVTLAELLAP